MKRAEKREFAEGDDGSRIKSEGTKLIVIRAKDILYRMSLQVRHKFGEKDHTELRKLRQEIDEVLLDSDSPALNQREKKPVWIAILPAKQDPCEIGEMFSLTEALLDCKKYLDSRLGG